VQELKFTSSNTGASPYFVVIIDDPTSFCDPSYPLILGSFL
jgi:hypothetical protein